MLKPIEMGNSEVKPRDEVLGKPLSRAERLELVKCHVSSNWHVNLAKNGVYLTLVKYVRNAFETSSLVKIYCRGMHASDYKKLGAKLKELVPCVLLSFDDEQILIWRGHGWKSMYHGEPILQNMNLASENTKVEFHKSKTRTSISIPKMTSL